MNLLASIFRRKKDDLSLQATDLVAESRNWYADRYETILIQRNILLVLLMIGLLCVLFGVVAVQEIASSKSVDPFVVEVEDKTGITNVVNPTESHYMVADETVWRYFITEYMHARETYDIVDADRNYNLVARLLSSNKVYRQFRNFLNEDPHSPRQLARGTDVKVTMKIRSVQFFDGSHPGEHKATVRFTVFVGGKGGQSYNKIATLAFEFVQLELLMDERMINPLGFQITEYRVDDEVL